MVTGKRGVDFLKTTENCQILLTNKQIIPFFLNISNPTYLFGAYQKDRSKTFLKMSHLSTSLTVVRELSQKPRRKADISPPAVLRKQVDVFISKHMGRLINRGTTILQMCLSTAFGKRALPLHILKLPRRFLLLILNLPGRPRQGPSSVPGKAVPATLS